MKNNEIMYPVTNFLLLTAFILTWMFGIHIAKGFFSTLSALCFPPWGWYLIVEKIAIHFGF